MAERIYAFRIDIEGRGAVAEQIEQIDQKLRKLSETRKKAIDNQKAGNITEKQSVEILKANRIETVALQAKKNDLLRTERALSTQVVNVKGSMAALRAETSNMVHELNNLNMKSAEGRRRFAELQPQVDKNRIAIRNFDRAMSGSSTLVGEYSRGIVGAFRSIAMGVFAAVAAVRTFSRVITKSATEFATYQKGLFNVLTLLDDYTAEFEKAFGEAARGLTVKYGLAIEDVNKALFDAVSAGVPAADAIEFMNKAAVLAIAGVTDLGTAVDGMTTILNAWGKGMDEAEQAAAALFSAQKYGKTTVAELSAEIGKSAPVAKLLNVSYQETLSLYAALTAGGLTPGRQLRI
jgi:regulator of replication initiation timing